MAGIWLHRLPEFFDKWGLDWDAYPGWETRARRGGAYGYNSVVAIQAHHTVSKTSLANDAHYCWVSDGNPNKPIGSVLLARDGKVLLGAAGPTNTSGRGGPMLTSNGVIPLDQGNTNIFAIEACNDGIGEPWPAKQQDAYPRVCCAVKDCVDSMGINANPIDWGAIHAHREWAPLRKVDPRGPARWNYPNSQVWDMGKFRFDCALVWLGHFTPPPAPKPDPTPIPPPAITEAPEMFRVWRKKSNPDAYCFGKFDEWWHHIGSAVTKANAIAGGAVDLATGRVVTSWADVTPFDDNGGGKMGQHRGDNF